jgi:hypothetical protein
MRRARNNQSGFVLIATMIMMSVFMALFTAYMTITRIELGSTHKSVASHRGFNAAEAGLNIRAQVLRDVFNDYSIPTGTAPSTLEDCNSSTYTTGENNFKCMFYQFGQHQATTYVAPVAGYPVNITIPLGERFQTLSAKEYKFKATSVSRNADGRTEAMLELEFKNRLIPLFQFAAFYNKDLEILPGPAMTLSGPVHTNGDLYLNAETSLTISGQVTATGNLYRGRKNTNVCNSKAIELYNPTSAVNLLPTCSVRTLINQDQLTTYNGNVKFGVQSVEVPQPESFDPLSPNVYWTSADLRLVLQLNSNGTVNTTNASTGVEVRNVDNTLDAAKTADINTIATCPGAIGESSSGANNGRVVGNSGTMKNFRENKYMRLLEVDMVGLLNCIKTRSLMGVSKTLADTTDGGLVFYLTVMGPDSNSAANNYGVRIRKGTKLQATASGSPTVKGLTIISDQAVYIHGHYNLTSKIPAAIMADSINLLSTNWLISDANSNKTIGNRIAANTTVNAAFLAGTDSTGNVEGAGGQGGAYNGGLENYPRLHEDWSGKTLVYRGSFVSLGKPRHVTGSWGSQSYSPPARDWNYDTSFNNAANLPPITPRFNYLKQQVFLRDFDL